MENFKILEEKENPLFNRKEVKFNIDAQVTPSKADVGKFISEKFSAQPETIKIKGIHGGFGSKTFTISSNIYKTREDLEKTEPKQKEKEKVKPEEKPMEVLKEEIKEEKPIEEKPEEKKEDKKEENIDNKKSDDLSDKIEKDSSDKDVANDNKQSESKVSE